MAEKYVKDRAHNKYPAYCCDDIDARVGALEAAVAALVAGTVTDGSVTLAKLADDAQKYAREINKGTLYAVWIGTTEEYNKHLEENGGEPLVNVKYIITDGLPSAHVTDLQYPVGVGALVLVKETYEGLLTLNTGETQRNLYITSNDDRSLFGKYAYLTYEEEVNNRSQSGLEGAQSARLDGLWRRIGVVYEYDNYTPVYITLWQKVAM